MSEVARIGSQLKRASEGGAWHGPALLELLADVPAARAAARPLAGAHSIWEIALHVAAWQDFARRALGGEPMPTALPAEEDWPPAAGEGEEAWRDAVANLREVNRRLREAVRKLSDEDLHDVVPGREYTFYFLLHGVVQHGLYHAGQIAILKRASAPGGES
ncbi:MAG TPA: DinB family protein [Pyrinomonadaceae bacterium]